MTRCPAGLFRASRVASQQSSIAAAELLDVRHPSWLVRLAGSPISQSTASGQQAEVQDLATNVQIRRGEYNIRSLHTGKPRLG